MKKKVGIIAVICFVLLVFFWQNKQYADKNLSIRTLQLKHGVEGASNYFSSYLETNNEKYYLFGISEFKVASSTLNCFPSDSRQSRALVSFFSLHAKMIAFPEVVKKYLLEIIEALDRLQEDIHDPIAYEKILNIDNLILQEQTELK